MKITTLKSGFERDNMRELLAFAGTIFGILAVAFAGYTKVTLQGDLSGAGSANMLGFSYFAHIFGTFAIVLGMASRFMFVHRDEKPSLFSNVALISGGFSLLALGALIFMG